jgi:hypothetical protein
MTTPTVTYSETTSCNTITWANLTDMVMNGGDIPISYDIEYSFDSITWIVLNSAYTKWLSYGHCPATVLADKLYYRLKA